jgi:hypothetical protein
MRCSQNLEIIVVCLVIEVLIWNSAIENTSINRETSMRCAGLYVKKDGIVEENTMTNNHTIVISIKKRSRCRVAFLHITGKVARFDRWLV